MRIEMLDEAKDLGDAVEDLKIKHSATPWKLDNGGISDAKGNLIADGITLYGDGCLMVAAPALYKALENITQRLGQSITVGDLLNDEVYVMRLVRDLAATGRMAIALVDRPTSQPE